MTEIASVYTNDVRGYTLIHPLPEIEGLPWNDVTGALVSALRPSTVRVIPAGAPVTSDAVLWRVTVYLLASGAVELVEQEVEVFLPPGIRDGHQLSVAIGRLR